ncbi:MAG: ferrochelatase [Flavobacteriales bacterium]
MKKAVLLLQLGTPDSPSVSDVRRYLSEFLNDPRIIDIPWLPRNLLVNLIIVPFRAPKSAKIYKELWEAGGGKSPLMTYTVSLKEKLQAQLENEATVHLAMRYGNPSTASVLEEMHKENYDKIVVLPLYPQYASASTGTALEETMRIISKWHVIPELSIISQYWNNEGYLNTFAEIGKKYNHEDYDHVLFSYHGLPKRQVDKVYEDKQCSNHSCEDEINHTNKFCYKATAYATTRELVKRLGIPEEKYTVCFQSRLDSKWLRPFSDEVVEEQAKNGAKKLLIFSPAFVADCLETIIEISSEYQEIFEEHGGEKVQLVESLNDHPGWVNALHRLVKERL